MASRSSNTEENSEIRYRPYFTRSSRSQSTSQPAFQSASQSTSTIDFPASPLPTPPQPIQKKKQIKLQLLPKDINLAKERLLALPQVEEHKEYTGSSEITLKENVSLEDYLNYRNKDPNLPVHVYLHDGTIKAYEVPAAPHAMVSAVIKGLVFSWNHQDLEYGDDTNMIVGKNSAKEPDSWVRPERRPQHPPFKAMDRFGGAYPTMIIEVGYTQILPDLHQKVALYFSQETSIQIVLTIKIFGLRQDNTFVLIASLYLRTNQNKLIPVDVRSFGTADPAQPTVNYIINTMNVPPNIFTGVGRTVNGVNYPLCNRAGIPEYQMNIPEAELFSGDPNGVPAAAIGGFNLDLWEVQVKARKGFNV